MRPKLSGIPGATAVLTAQQDLTIGARSAQTQFQYTLTSESIDDLMEVGASRDGPHAEDAAVAGHRN